MELAKQTLALETKIMDAKSSGIFIDRLNKDTGDIAHVFMQLNYSISDMVTNVGIMIAIFFVDKYVFIYYVLSFILIFFLRECK